MNIGIGRVYKFIVPLVSEPIWDDFLLGTFVSEQYRLLYHEFGLTPNCVGCDSDNDSPACIECINYSLNIYRTKIKELIDEYVQQSYSKDSETRGCRVTLCENIFPINTYYNLCDNNCDAVVCNECLTGLCQQAFLRRSEVLCVICRRSKKKITDDILYYNGYVENSNRSKTLLKVHYSNIINKVVHYKIPLKYNKRIVNFKTPCAIDVHEKYNEYSMLESQNTHECSVLDYKLEYPDKNKPVYIPNKRKRKLPNWLGVTI